MSTLSELMPGVDLCQIPMGVAPEGQLSNFEAESPLRPLTISISLITTVFALIPSSGRIIANCQKLGWGDLFVVLAMLLNISLATAMIVFVKYFRHMWDVPLCWINGQFEEVSYVWQICYVLSMFFAKSATLMLFIQLFNVSRPMRIAIWVGLTLNFLITTTSIITSTYFAAPHAGETWDQLLLRVMNTIIFPLYWAVAQGSVGSLLDIYIFILPLPVIYKLNLSFSRKMQLMSLFLVGLLGVLASLISLVYRVKSIQGSNTDKTYNTGVLLICNLVELNAAVVVCSAPAFASFLRGHVKSNWVFKKLSSLYTGSHGEGNRRSEDEFAIDPNRPRTGVEAIPAAKREDRRDRAGYIEMRDTWLLKSAASTVDIEASRDTLALDSEPTVSHGIHQTIDIEQASLPRPPNLAPTGWKA